MARIKPSLGYVFRPGFICSDLTDSSRRGRKPLAKDLLAINLKSVRAYLLKEDFDHFWRYKSVG
jgi:hypothetical protein